MLPRNLAAIARSVGLSVTLASSLLLAPSLASAHFPFIVPSKDGATGRLIMSETLEPDDAVHLGLLSRSELRVRTKDGATTPLPAPRADEEGDSLSLAIPGSGTRVVEGVVDLGVMQRGSSPAHILVYYPKTVLGDPFDPATVVGTRAPIEFVAEVGNHCYHLRLLVDGRPAPDAEMHLIHEDGRDLLVKTDSAGRTPPLMPGRIAAWARHWLDEKGERDGRAYTQVRRYATYVADLPDPHGMPERAPRIPRVAQQGAETGTGTPTLQATPISRAGVPVGPLPRAIASFGAVATDGWVYLYGGHAGARHDYSTATVSGRLSRARIDELVAGTARWEELPGGPSVQGMNLASHGGRIIRAGGMEPRNAAGEAAENHSIAEVAAFDPASLRWSSLPPLPEPRSSHDIVVVGNELVVVGGWNMAGSRARTSWPAETLILDLSNPESGWQSIEQPFRRRALIAAAIGDEIFVLGGFDENDRAHVEVEVLHVPTRRWSKGPSLPVDGAAGFAPAAAVYDGRLHASVASGELFVLDRERSEWQLVALTTPRIVHRLVADDDGILVLGGAREAEMTSLVEHVTLRPGAAPVAPVSAPAVAKLVQSAWSHPKSDEVADAMHEVDAALKTVVQASARGWSQSDAATGGDADSELRAAVARIAERLASVPAREVDAPEPFVAMLSTGVSAADRLREALARGVDPSNRPDVRKLDEALSALQASCRDCHRQYR
jgi:hypothetical protein